VAEKSRFIDIRYAGELVAGIVKSIASKSGSRMGLIVYGRHALPLVDLTLDVRLVAEAYGLAPIMPGAPDPEKGLKEAGEMLSDLSDNRGSQLVALTLWSYRGVIRPSIVLPVNYIESLGGEVLFLLITSKHPRLLSRYLERSNAKIVTVKRGTNVERVVSRIFEAINLQ